jgi:hypothetical protein
MPMTRLVALSLLAACGGDANNPGDGSTTDGTPVDTTTGSDAIPTEHFSFFVTSLAALRELSGNQQGFGGDLRFGETGAGAGLRGADKICRTIAERSLTNAGNKTWHAFLSFADDGTGNQVDARDRVGTGPWYDRLGRMLAPDLTSLLKTRPSGGDAVIKNDFPNEDGVPNHDPDGTGDVDNHDFLTGSDSSGRLLSGGNCLDWTANAGNKQLEGQPRVGHSWPRMNESWISTLTESGCAPGVNLIEMGPPMQSSNTVGSGGGYGGFYCFALEP